MLQKAILLGCTVFLLLSAQESRSPVFELGVIVGEPTGLNGKYWFDSRNALDAASGWSFSEERLDIFVDYLFHYFWFNLEKGELPLYFGLGGTLKIEDENFFGARLPLGISYLFPDAPLSVSVDIAPIIKIIPDSELSLAGGVSFRLTFL